jgi:Uncharacterised protein family (UPF0172)
VQLDGPALQQLLAGSSTKPPLRLFWKEGAKGWSAPGASGGNVRYECPTATAAGLLTQYMEEGRQHRLVDFEHHLDDLAADWLNPELLA